jgi:2-methylcitrate dehydratase PrpD
MTTPEEQLSEFAAKLDLADVPAEALERAKLLVLDQLGIQLACAELPWVAMVRDYAAANGAAGECTVVGTDVRLMPESAVLANGTAGHGFEADDYCPTASAHAGCVAVPTALALSQVQNSTGREFLTAVVLGAEMIVRAARATMPPMLYERGFHETCAHGVFGSALAAGRLLELTPTQIVHALGIAGSHASGTTEFSRSGGDVKRLHGGMGAAGGVRGAYLAQAGFTGPTRVLAGERGFLHAFAPAPKPEWLTKDLGQDWQLLNLVTKPYCCAGRNTPHIDATAEIMASSGITAADVAKIRVAVDQGAFTHGSTVGDGPVDAITAQFSTHVGVALRLVRGRNDFATYFGILEAGGLDDPEVLAAAAKVEMYVDPECDAAFPGAFKTTVTIETVDGRSFTAAAEASREHAPSAEAIRAKFREFGGRRLDAGALDRLEAVVLDIENQADVSALAALVSL